MAGTVVQRTCQVQANGYFGLSASTAVTLFTAGAVPYQVILPDPAALATFGWTGQKYRVLVFWGTLSSVLSGTPATNVGLNMTESGFNLGSKLGYGAANDGSLASIIATWPTLVIGLQGPSTWFPVISGAATRGWWMMHDAIVADVFANYNCDPNYIYGVGTSGGGGNLMEYVMGHQLWPTRYPVSYAAVTTIGGSFSGSGTRQDWPEAIPGENSTNQTFPRLGRLMANMPLPWMDVHSTNDEQSTPAIYNSWEDNVKLARPNTGNPIPSGGQSAGTQRYHGKYFQFYEYTGVNAPLHAHTFGTGGSIFDYFFGNNAVGGGGALSPTDPWSAWMFQQKLIQVPLRGPVNPVYDYSGGSAGPTPPTPGIGSGSTMIRRRRR